MKRLLMSCSVALSIVALSSASAQAEVKTRDKGQVKFEGMLGRMVGIFGGKAAREGVVSTNAVKGDRKATMNDSTGRIVDLAEEKVYELDLKKKTYTVVTFAQMRQQLKEAQEKAARDAAEARKEQAGKDKDTDKEQPKEKSPEVDVDFDLKETGQKKQVAGYEAREVVMTITVREKGKALEDSGGIVMTSDMWLGPEIPAMKELAEFELRYWKAIAPETTGASAEQMAAALAMYPMLKQGMERLNKEKVNMRGTALSTVTTFDAVKGKEQMAKESESNSSSSSSAGAGGLSGMLARKMMKKPSEDKSRATIMTATTETLEISTSVAASDLEIPAGFKLEK
jgi:hypothetical protein